MATKNFTVEQLFCPPANLTAGLHGHLIFISALNIFLSITAFLGNALILTALHKECSLHPPSKLLLRNLATTDLCVGLISHPLFVAYLLFVLNEHRNICRYLLAAKYLTEPTLGGVSLLTLTAISVDRLLALLLGLRYKQFVTLKRTYVIVITFWVVPAVVSASYFWNPFIVDLTIIIVVAICLVTSVFSYTTIFLTLRHRQNRLQDQAQQPDQANQLNIARYRKAVSTALWLQLTLIACYLPQGIVMALSQTHNEVSSSDFLALRYSITFLFLNSSLNPILYFWKIKELRQTLKHTIRQALCCSSS